VLGDGLQFPRPAGRLRQAVERVQLQKAVANVARPPRNAHARDLLALSVYLDLDEAGAAHLDPLLTQDARGATLRRYQPMPHHVAAERPARRACRRVFGYPHAGGHHAAVYRRAFALHLSGEYEQVLRYVPLQSTLPDVR